MQHPSKHQEDRRSPPERSASFWDGVARQMQARKYYIHPVLGAYKQGEFIRFIDSHVTRACGRSVKTDSFEEAFGEDGLVAWLAERSSLVIGMDISTEIVAQGRRRVVHPNIRWVASHIAQMPFKDRSVDLILSTSTYGYLPDIQLGLKEARRMLSPGGTLIVAINNRQNFLFNPLVKMIVSKKVPFPLSRSFRRDEFKGILEQAGFRVESSRPVVHIVPLLKTIVYWLARLGQQTWLRKVMAWLEDYSERATPMHDLTGWFIVYKAVKV